MTISGGGSSVTPAALPGRAAVIYNPVSANLDALKKAFASEEKRAGLAPALWFATTPDEDAAQVATREALRENPVVIVAVGGDGTVRAVAETMYESGIPVGIIPAGTGNLLARTLRLPLTDIKKAVRVALAGTDKAVDIVLANLELNGVTRSHVFLVMAGIGLDADMAAGTDGRLKKRIGWLAYVAPIARSVGRNRHHGAVITIDGDRQHSIRAHTMIVGNCGTLPGNLLLLPEAVIDDGLLDAVVLRPKGPGGWALIWSRLAIGGALHRLKASPEILRAAPAFHALRYAQARTLSVKFDAPQRIELDGDSFGEVSTLTVTVVPHGLILRVPAT